MPQPSWPGAYCYIFRVVLYTFWLMALLALVAAACSLKRVGGGGSGLHIGVVGHDLLLERGT